MKNQPKTLFEQKDLLETTIREFESHPYFGPLKFPKVIERLYQATRFEKRKKGLKNNTRRAHEIAARYGGEEFVILLPHVDMDGTKILQKRLERTLNL